MKGKRDKYLILAKGIARWKIDTPLENWLSYKADYSECWKRIYVAFYKIFDHKYYKGGMKFIDAELQKHKSEWEGVDEAYVRRDMIYSLHRFGANFNDYWCYNFLDLSPIGREKYVVDKLRYGYDEFLTNAAATKLCSDKQLSYQHLKKWYKRDCEGFNSPDEIERFRAFVGKHPEFIIKPIAGEQGFGIEKVNLAPDQIDAYYTDKIGKGAFIVEEVIHPVGPMAELHPQSVNTIRVLTLNVNGEIYVVGAGARIGVGNSLTDNAGSGGIYAGVDEEHGILISQARDYAGHKYYLHPDTGIVIPGLKLPEWDTLLKEVKEAAKTMKEGNLYSWDYTYSDKGWTIVEVNTGGGFVILQSAQRVPIKKKLYKYIDKLYEK